MKVLLLGSGGREHAIAWKIAQSNRLTKLYIAPGNAGTEEVGTNVPIAVNDFEEIKTFVIEIGIDMVVVGPEDPLVNGIYDFFKEDEHLQHVAVIGPSAKAAALEGSKDFAKAFMQRHNIPTARYQTFDEFSYEGGCAFIDRLKPPYVLKADGLAAGKGVLILDDADEAKAELKEMLLNEKFGDAGRQVVIEEFLHGIELSVFVLTDGKDYVILPEAKDYKRIGEGDTGLNTGGMGSISPVPFADESFMQKVEERVIKPTVQGIEKEGFDYKGFVFFGLMNVNGDPYVIEYNVRMGDPETESVMPRVKSDLLESFVLLAKGKLAEYQVEVDPRTVVATMMVSGGYPEAYEKGIEMTIPEADQDLVLFHAGTKAKDGKIVTAGGRVIACAAYGDKLEDALLKSYAQVGKVIFDKAYFRTDLGKDLL